MNENDIINALNNIYEVLHDRIFLTLVEINEKLGPKEEPKKRFAAQQPTPPKETTYKTMRLVNKGRAKFQPSGYFYSEDKCTECEELKKEIERLKEELYLERDAKKLNKHGHCIPYRDDWVVVDDVGKITTECPDCKTKTEEIERLKSGITDVFSRFNDIVWKYEQSIEYEKYVQGLENLRKLLEARE